MLVSLVSCRGLAVNGEAAADNGNPASTMRPLPLLLLLYDPAEAPADAGVAGMPGDSNGNCDTPELIAVP